MAAPDELRKDVASRLGALSNEATSAGRALGAIQLTDAQTGHATATAAANRFAGSAARHAEAVAAALEFSSSRAKDAGDRYRGADDDAAHSYLHILGPLS
jgi:hypothetical protein